MKASACSSLCLGAMVLIAGCAHVDVRRYATFDVTPGAGHAETYQGLPLESGQIIVSDQGTPVSLFIALAGAQFQPFVHAGVISIEAGEPFVYESRATIDPIMWGPPTDSASGRVRRTPFDTYVARQRIVGIYDPPDNVDRARVAAFARQSYADKTPFDPYFDDSDHAKVYCSEFVAVALESAGADRIEVTPVNGNPSLRVVLEWLKVPPTGIVFAGSLVESARPVALLSKRYSPAQVEAFFALKRELHRRFTDDQRLGNVFVWRMGSVGFRPEVASFLDAGLSAAGRPGVSAESSDALVASLADRMLGPFVDSADNPVDIAGTTPGG